MTDSSQNLLADRVFDDGYKIGYRSLLMVRLKDPSNYIRENCLLLIRVCFCWRRYNPDVFLAISQPVLSGWETGRGRNEIYQLRGK